MADVYDIVEVVANLVNAAVQPLVGTNIALYPTIDASVFGPDEVCPSILVMPGNVLLKDLMFRLEQGKAVIQIEPDEANVPTAQFMAYDSFDPLNTYTTPAIAIATDQNGKRVTVTGTIQAGDTIGVSVGTLGAAYGVQATDTIATICSSFAAAINATTGLTATFTATTVTITSSGSPSFAVGSSDSSKIVETMRRRKAFFATLYATTPYIRAYIGKTLENVFQVPARLLLNDGTYATLIGPMSSHDYDDQQRDTTLMRRVWWTFDFLTTQALTTTQVVAALETAQVAYSGITPTPPSATQL